MIDIMRRLIAHRAQQQSNRIENFSSLCSTDSACTAQHEQRLIQYLQAKNTQLKLALVMCVYVKYILGDPWWLFKQSELRNHDGLHELSSAMAIRNASLLGPDFNFQSLGFVPATTLPMVPHRKCSRYFRYQLIILFSHSTGSTVWTCYMALNRWELFSPSL
jgi:hypothetical protein